MSSCLSECAVRLRHKSFLSTLNEPVTMTTYSLWKSYTPLTQRRVQPSPASVFRRDCRGNHDHQSNRFRPLSYPENATHTPCKTLNPSRTRKEPKLHKPLIEPQRALIIGPSTKLALSCYPDSRWQCRPTYVMFRIPCKKHPRSAYYILDHCHFFWAPYYKYSMTSKPYSDKPPLTSETPQLLNTETPNH